MPFANAPYRRPLTTKVICPLSLGAPSVHGPVVGRSAAVNCAVLSTGTVDDVDGFDPRVAVESSEEVADVMLEGDVPSALLAVDRTESDPDAHAVNSTTAQRTAIRRCVTARTLVLPR